MCGQTTEQMTPFSNDHYYIKAGSASHYICSLTSELVLSNHSLKQVGKLTSMLSVESH